MPKVLSLRHSAWLRAVTLVALLVATTVAVAAAHETWLLPMASRVDVGRTVLLELTSGMGFDTPEYAIAPARLTHAMARLHGSTSRLTIVRPDAHALRLRWTPRTRGVALLSIALAPKRLDLDTAKVAEYLDEISASDSLRGVWAAMPAPRRWREEYVKYATTFVRVGSPPPTDSSWRIPARLGLQIVPQQDPTNLRAGDTLTVLVLHGGRPLAGFAVGARPARPPSDTAGAGHDEKFVQTALDGRARTVLTRAGRWLLHGTDLRRVRGEPGLEWRSEFTTLTLSVSPSLQESAP